MYNKVKILTSSHKLSHKKSPYTVFLLAGSQGIIFGDYDLKERLKIPERITPRIHNLWGPIAIITREDFMTAQDAAAAYPEHIPSWATGRYLGGVFDLVMRVSHKNVKAAALATGVAENSIAFELAKRNPNPKPRFVREYGEYKR